MVNILAYADDLVLLAPSWRALQQLLDKLQVTAGDIDMWCNSKKTVCMIFSPKRRSFSALRCLQCFDAVGWASGRASSL